MSSINLAGFKDIPPVSKHTPLPIKLKGFDFFFEPFHSRVTKYVPLTLPWPTPSKALHPNFFSSFLL